MNIFGALFWFLFGAATTVLVGVSAIQTGIDIIMTELCNVLPFCDWLGSGI